MKNKWLIITFSLVVLAFVVFKLWSTEKPIQESKQTLVAMDVSGIFEIDVTGVNGFYRITKDLTEEWKLNDSLPINQALVMNYIGQFEKITTNNYVKPFDVSHVSSGDIYSLLIKSADELIDLEIKCYKITDSTYPYILQSNRNQEVFFGSNEKGLYRELFWEQAQFQ